MRKQIGKRADCRSVVRYPDLSVPSHRRSRDSHQNRLISYRPDPAILLGLANTKEKQMARFVLVHGGFFGAWIWFPLMDRLKAAGHLVEAFDLPGLDDDHTSASEVSLDSYAGRACEVLAASSEPAIVVGHSMGGIVATQAAAPCPARVRRSYTGSLLAKGRAESSRLDEASGAMR
jgi:pimeloyl-ACP methyl ester carboxylesterase